MAATALVLSVAMPAGAGDSGFYVAGGIGRAGHGDVCNNLVTIGLDLSSCDDSRIAFKGMVGYQVLPLLGFEIFYADYGKAEGTGTIATLPVTASYESKAFGITAVGSWPLTRRLSVQVRGGTAWWNLEVAATLMGTTLSFDESSTTWTIGLGLKYDLTQDIALRLDWDRINDIGDGTTTLKTDINTLMGALQYNF